MSTMSDEVRAEYEKILATVVIRYGSIIALGATRYGWHDYDATQHIRTCGVQLRGTVDEDAWYEFAGTFVDDMYVQGTTLHDVSCSCGKLTSRRLRWSASVSDVAEAVISEAYATWKQ